MLGMQQLSLTRRLPTHLRICSRHPQSRSDHLRPRAIEPWGIVSGCTSKTPEWPEWGNVSSSTAYLELGIVHVLVLPWLVDGIAQLPPETHVGKPGAGFGPQLTIPRG